MTDDTRTERMTAYTLEGAAGTYHGTTRQRLPHTVAADALRVHTGRPWQRVEYLEVRRSAGVSVWEIEGTEEASNDRSGPYRLTIEEARS